MSLYDAAKDAAKILKDAGKIDEYLKILDLIDDSFQKREEIEKLKEENRSLKDKLENHPNNYTLRNNAYYNKTTNAGPYCSRCIEKDRVTITLIADWIGANHATCPQCKNQVNYTGRQDTVKTILPRRLDSTS